MESLNKFSENGTKQKFKLLVNQSTHSTVKLKIKRTLTIVQEESFLMHLKKLLKTIELDSLNSVLN